MSIIIPAPVWNERFKVAPLPEVLSLCEQEETQAITNARQLFTDTITVFLGTRRSSCDVHLEDQHNRNDYE